MSEHEARRLEDRVAPAMDRIAHFVYGHELPIFGEASVVIVPNDVKVERELPKFLETSEGYQLQLSAAGAERWKSKLSSACDVIDVHPYDLYISSGLAQLELIESAKAAQNSDSADFVLERHKRVIRAFKAIERDDNVKQVAAQFAEETQVSMMNVVDAFNFEELVKLNMLRYGIGVSFASMGIKPKQVKLFQQTARTEAVTSINKYFSGAASFLIRQAMPKQEIVERVDGIYRLEPPIIEVAASSPMNVTYLFGK